MSGQLRLLQIACSAKSRPRTVTISRPSRDDPLPFNIMGGADNGYGIFVSNIEDCNNSSVRVGDELLSVNNINFRCINLSKAFDVLKGATHLVIVLKCNFLGTRFILTVIYFYFLLTNNFPRLPRMHKLICPTHPTSMHSETAINKTTCST